MDNYHYCCYCGKRFGYLVRKTADHLIPLAKGGVNKPVNKRPACANCNNLKDCFYPEHWLIELNKKLKQSKIDSERYELNIMIENLEHIITYVQKSGLKLFTDKYHYERYIDRRTGIIER